MQTPTVPGNPQPGDEFLYKYGLRELKHQSNDYDALDAKTGVVLGFSLVSIAEILGFLLLTSAEGHKLSTPHPIAAGVCFYAGLACTVAAVFTGFLELRPRNYSGGPTLEALRPLADKDPNVIKSALVSEVDRACDDNEEIIDSKMYWAIRTAGLVGFSLVFYAIAAAILFYSTVS